MSVAVEDGFLHSYSLFQIPQMHIQLETLSMRGNLKRLKLLLETQKWLNLNTKAPSCQRKKRSSVWVSNQIRCVADTLLFISMIIINLFWFALCICFYLLLLGTRIQLKRLSA